MPHQAQEAALYQAKIYFEYANNHEALKTWREKASEDFGFYDGTHQWPPEILAELQERGQTPVTVNKVKNLINYLSGVEIQTRFRVGFRSHSGRIEDDRLAKAITHLSYSIQENQDMPHKASLKFRDALITGIGWSNLYKDPKSSEIVYEYVNPMNVFYDPDDLSPTLTGMQFVGRTRWIPLERAEELWPKKRQELRSLFERKDSISHFAPSGEFWGRNATNLDLYTQGEGEHQSRLMVVEVQYKRSRKVYKGLDYQGHPFETFDKENALDLAGSAKEIEEDQATQTMRVVFTGDVLLQYRPLNPSLPNMKDFSYIPCIWSRRHQDGVPEGWLSVMKDLQRESNYRRTKLVNNLNSFRAVIDTDTFSGKTPDEIRQELKRPDSVLVKTPNSLLEVESNRGLAPGQFEMLERTDKELQQVTGIYDDALGKQTNAESGRAIKERQVNSVRNQVFAFDNLRMMKKREAHMLLDLIQGGGDTFLHTEILEDEEQESLLLNIVRNVQGKKVVFNDIRTLPLSLYVEEVPDYESSQEEQQAVLQSLLGNANASLIMQSPLFMKRMGIRDYEALAQEMQALSSKHMEEQGAMKQASVSPRAVTQQADLG